MVRQAHHDGEGVDAFHPGAVLKRSKGGAFPNDFPRHPRRSTFAL